MRFERRNRRAMTFVGALLLSSAFAIPAFGQIEEIVVTAQKRAEDIQTVPISISAFTTQDLQAHQIDQFKDLVFNTPNVSYSKIQFTGSDFQIRGIGLTAVGYDSEPGVATHLDDVYLAQPLLAEATFFDLDRIEVLRGPQSTLYGRGATGGTVNVITAKPVLDAFHADLEGTAGNYGMFETRGMLNLPIIDGQLGIRLAGDWLNRDGFVTNVANGQRIDSRNQISGRASVRWEPSSATTIDFVAAVENEDDTRMRSQKQYCSSDPTGTLGCLPDSIGNGLVNVNSNLWTIASSIQGINSGFAGTPLAGIGNALGLFDLTQQPQLPAACISPGNLCNPADPRKVYTDFTPHYRANDTFYAVNWKQHWADWLDSTLVGGWDRNTVWSQESYNNVAGLPLDENRLAVAEGTLLGLLNLLGGPNYAGLYAPFFLSHPGELPESGVGHFGITGGNVRAYLPNVSTYDQSNQSASQYSLELRFNTNFDGPLNFLLAGYYLHTSLTGDYYVNGDTLDYPGIVLGSILGSPALGIAPQCYQQGCIFSPSYYHNDGDFDRLNSKAVFGEAYYQIEPDLLKLTVGLRWTNDEKFQIGRIRLYDALVPLGTTDEHDAIAGWQVNDATYDKLTGRAVLDWTPKLDVTDATLVYASYARGYKAGGFNPGIEPGLDVPVSYSPEAVDAFELGTKNTLLGSTLQANADVWYYDYRNLQVSTIENNTSVNQNVDAKLWGAEGEFFWAPISNLQFNLSFGATHSSIGNSELIDDRNPTAGRNDVLLVKDATVSAKVGQNCVLYYNGATLGSLPAGLGFFAPPGGIDALAAHGVAYASFGTCSTDPAVVAALNAQGFSIEDPKGHGTHVGAFVNLNGNQLQNTPDFTISVGGQYTLELGGDYTLVPRLDYYWQAGMYGRIFNDPSDRIEPWGIANAQVTLNAPDSTWYATAWIKNIADSSNVTGMYLANSASGLYTDAFLGDPRTYGLTAGIHL